MQDDYFSEQLLMTGFLIILLKWKHTETFNKNGLTAYMELSGDWNLFALSPLKCKASQILNVVKEFVTKFFQQTFTEGEMFRKYIFTVFRNTKILPTLISIAPR